MINIEIYSYIIFIDLGERQASTCINGYKAITSLSTVEAVEVDPWLLFFPSTPYNQPTVMTPDQTDNTVYSTFIVLCIYRLI